MGRLIQFLWGNRLLRKIYYDILPFSIQAYLTKVIFKPDFGKNMVISKGTKFYYGKVKFGRGVRIARDSIFSNVVVGNYTVFAEHFRMYVAHHDYTAFSINDIFPARLKNQYGISCDESILHEPNEKSSGDIALTEIGGDVWIGEFVTVKPGVKIGDGAVVAGGSIVTHDVEPFSVVGGCPAKFIKWRFEEEKIELMKHIRWWEWPEEKIAKNYERLCNFDKTLIKECNEVN